MPIIGKAVSAAYKLSKYDSKAWDKLYFGIRSDIKQGIRTGFGVGGAIGSFINDESNPFDEDGKIPNASSNSYKKGNSRQYSSRGRRRYKYNRNSCNCRKRLRRNGRFRRSRFRY